MIKDRKRFDQACARYADANWQLIKDMNRVVTPSNAAYIQALHEAHKKEARIARFEYLYAQGLDAKEIRKEFPKY